jgi:hypothetical protein
VGTNVASLRKVLASKDRISFLLGSAVQSVELAHRQRAVRTLGQLLVGRAAERAFESIYKEEMHTHELELRDLREGRTDTDYRLYNGAGRPVYRINIKFHGSLFRRAPDLVGLDPEDCFALATYKIYWALKKQDDEALPYLFAIVGVRSMTAENIGSEVPSAYTGALAFMYSASTSTGIRNFEDALVDLVVRAELPVFSHVFHEIKNARWYVISARRAHELVKQMLFDRIFALRIRGFAQQFRSAELDMHFSLTGDLTPLKEFLHVLKEEGHPKVVTKIERGEY